MRNYEEKLNLLFVQIYRFAWLCYRVYFGSRSAPIHIKLLQGGSSTTEAILSSIFSYFIGKYTRLFWKIWGKTFAHVGEDWIILAVLGIIIAIMSYMIDKGVMMCNKGKPSLV